jgi:HSP20 family protein
MTRLPAKTESGGAPERSASPGRWPLETLRREVDRLFDDFDDRVWRFPFRASIFDIEPFWRREMSWSAAPAVDIAETDKAYEITAELPGMDEKNIEVKLVNGGLTIKGEKREEKEEKKKDYYLHERHFGAFERCFRVPEGVEADKVEAQFKKGVLKVTLPKSAAAQKPEKKIAINAA